MPVTSNILDEIHPTLAVEIWDDPSSPEPHLKPHVEHWIKQHIYAALEHNGYRHPQRWLKLYLTGSLTTYQYGPNSDCDISLFVDSDQLPEWSRAEMIGIMVSQVDGVTIPGTPYPVQDFVVASHIKPADLYRPGLRAGYSIDERRWINPPERERDHNVEMQENGFYVYALECADKMERLLRYEPNKAVEFWHAIHKRRMRDQRAGKGDFSESNIVYKFLANRGLFPRLEEATGEHIASVENPVLYPTVPPVLYHGTSIPDEIISSEGLIGAPVDGRVYFSEDPETARSYAGEGGSVWAWRPPKAWPVKRQWRQTEDDLPGIWYSERSIKPSWTLTRHSRVTQSETELHVGLEIPEEATKKIRQWCEDQDWPEGTELEDPSDYHITLMYSPDGHHEHKDADWIDHLDSAHVRVTGIDSFEAQDKGYAYVLRVDAPEVRDRAVSMQAKAEDHGLEITHFPGGYKPHLTVAYGPEKMDKDTEILPLEFDAGPSSVSPPRTEKTAMAADPYWLDNWIERNGPYAWHATAPENVSSILKNGLIPWDEGSNPGSFSGTYLESRPGHVYMREEHPRVRDTFANQPRFVRIDLRKLNPANLNPDEDQLVGEWDRFGIPLPNTTGEGKGSWFEDHDVSDPSQTAWSMEGMGIGVGTMAHRGVVPPEAIDYPYGQRTMARTAGLTRSQRLRKQQHWNDALGPDYAPVVRQFPDGWSIRQLKTPHAECYEGEMMPNCVGSADSALRMTPEALHEPASIGSNPMSTYYSVRDPDNLPHATFAHDPEHDSHFFDLGLEGRAGANASKYVPYVHDWWKSIGGRPLTPQEWRGSTFENESTTDGMPELGSPEHMQAQAEPGWDQQRRPEAWWEKPKEQWGSYVSPHLHRAAKHLNRAMQMSPEDGEAFLRRQLPNNFKPDSVESLVRQHNDHRKRVEDYEQSISPDSIKPYHRQEFPEFYWMHGSYGPDVYNQVKQTQELYRAIPWNHPSAFHQGLMNSLIGEADVDPTMAEDIANRWVNAHLQSQGMQADRAPMVTVQSPEQQNAWEAMKTVIPPENHDRAWSQLEHYFTEQVPDPNWDESQAWSQPPKWSPTLGIWSSTHEADLVGLPQVNVPPQIGPLPFRANPDIQRIAEEYNRANGLGPHPTDYVPVNPQNAARIAQEYERMPHNPQDPQVQQAYQALANEVRAQYDHAVNNGYQFEFYPPDRDPYPDSPRQAVLDLHQNKHMYVYPTEGAFGSSGDPTGHPLLQDSGVRWNGQPVTHNDLFRAIHDFYGHAKEGLGFRADGEDNAYRQHQAMFSPPAQQALASETRGQNSWVNYGPHGDQNQTAGQGDTVYAPQKAGLMPSWTADPNLHQQGTWSRVSADISAEVVRSTLADGGITIGLHGDQPSEGFAFSIQQENEEKIPLNQFTVEVVQDYISRHYRDLSEPGRYLGAWISEGSVYLDVSQVEHDHDRAYGMASDANQLAMYDLSNFNEIPIGRPMVVSTA